MRIISEFTLTKASLAHSRMTAAVLCSHITWVPKRRSTKEQSAQRSARRLTVIESWQFSCICRNLHISQFFFFFFNEMKTGGNLHRSAKTASNQEQGGGHCLDADLNQPPKMVRQVNLNSTGY